MPGPADGSDPTPLYERDRRALSAAQHLRFFPLAAVGGHGARLVEEGGRELIDLSGSWSAAGVGYGNQRVAAAVASAVSDMPGAGILSGAHEPGARLAERLLELIPTRGDDRAVYLGLAGSDANAAALNGIRAWSDRPRILTFDHSYHAGLGPAQHISGLYTAAGVSAASGLVTVPFGDLDAAESHLRAGDVAAVFAEPILSDGGLIVPPDDFLPRLRVLCDETGTLLVLDEVKVGCGRTGLLLASQHGGVEADIVTVGKSLGGGLPLSAAVGRRDVLDAAPGGTILTTAGNPVSCAAGLAVLDALHDDGLIDRARDLGHVLAEELADLLTLPLVSDVRSRGLVGGIELRRDDGAPATQETARVVFRAWQLGVVAYYVGPHSNVLEITPPLVIDETDLRSALRTLAQAISDVSNGAVSAAEIAPFRGW